MWVDDVLISERLTVGRARMAQPPKEVVSLGTSSRRQMPGEVVLQERAPMDSGAPPSPRQRETDDRAGCAHGGHEGVVDGVSVPPSRPAMKTSVATSRVRAFNSG